MATNNKDLDVLRTDMRTELNKSRERISVLTDRISVLEHSLKRTQELVQQDMNRLITIMEQKN